MTDIIMQAYKAVEKAMEQYNQVLLEQVKAMRESESTDADKLERMTHGAKAMRDSSAIYLSYAKFIAYGMPDSEEMIQDDLQG
jgi:phage gp36-like protein